MLNRRPFDNMNEALASAHARNLIARRTRTAQRRQLMRSPLS
ncbi:hypothetical protein GLA29479_1878 [Lysobacter antibioticus]|nr:hypothetical protein GLA29479_1878 [Lysobacter antibioticus]